MTDTQARATDQNNESPRRGREIPYTAIGLVTAAVWYGLSLWLLSLHPTEGGYRLADGFSVFSGIFLVTLALERLLEPVRQLLGPKTFLRKDELARESATARTRVRRRRRPATRWRSNKPRSTQNGARPR